MKALSATVENGSIKLDQPVKLPEGRKLELLVRVVPTPEESSVDVREFEEALDGLAEAVRERPAGWWEEFDRELRENRVNFPERIDFSDMKGDE